MRSKDGRELNSLVHIRSHFARAKDGSPTRGYCIKAWPLILRTLPPRQPTPDVVMLAS
jgi:hypothetical protein